MKIITYLFFFITIQFYGQETIEEAISTYNSNSVEYISVEGLKQKLTQKENVYLLDAREKEEFEVSHLKDAIWLGYSALNLDAIEKIDKSSTIIVYCSIGVRSEQVGEKLLEMGYRNVFNLYGGIFDWVNSSNKVFNTKDEPTQKVHAYDRFWGRLLEHAEKVY